MTTNKILFVIFFFIIGCNSFDKKLAIDKLSEEEKHKLYSKLQDKRIAIGGERDTSFIYIKTYDSTNKVNEYFLDWENNKGLLLRDNIQYENDSSIVNPNTKELSSSIIHIIEECKKLGIKCISSDWEYLGVNLHILLNNGEMRLYVIHPERVRADILSKSKKISKNWYSYIE